MLCTNQQLPQQGGAVPIPIWVGSKWLLAFSRIPFTRALSSHKPFFLPCSHLNYHRRAARSFFAIGQLFFFSCFSLSHLLIFFLLLMSGNVNCNPGLIFRCSVCIGNVTYRGRSVQCCTCSKWVHLRCSPLLF